MLSLEIASLLWSARHAELEAMLGGGGCFYPGFGWGRPGAVLWELDYGPTESSRSPGRENGKRSRPVGVTQRHIVAGFTRVDSGDKLNQD
jgi:hypothetical protein